ncbi:hypothetical protein [Muribacter muris]|nr:hypothetical protein [Muribacter muris]
MPAWTGILMLRNASSPETYFQEAFRVQISWVLRGYDGRVAKRYFYLSIP